MDFHSSGSKKNKISKRVLEMSNIWEEILNKKGCYFFYKYTNYPPAYPLREVMQQVCIQAIRNKLSILLVHKGKSCSRQAIKKFFFRPEYPEAGD